MKRCLGLSLLVAALSLVQPIQAAELQVMTQNQYVGANLAPLLTAPPEQLNDAVVAILQQIAASKPAARIQALAAEIAKEKPPVVGLQEVFEISCTESASQPDVGCDDPSIREAFGDHQQDTLTALQGMYEARAIVTNINLSPGQPIPGIPVTINGAEVLVGVVDRDVILVRSDIVATPVVFPPELCTRPSKQGCNYNTVLSFPTPIGTINVERGFVAVDATVNGKAYRVVNTHLEETDPNRPELMFFQSMQAMELLGILPVTPSQDQALIVVGDFNSSPEDAPLSPSLPTPYAQFIEAGYNDAWALRPGHLAGYTCCQGPDLLNRQSLLSQRIDMLFSLEYPTKVRRAQVVGDTVSAKTHPPGRGLWPSDHGAVIADLQF